jgi:CheY-like chemotaxis protein
LLDLTAIVRGKLHVVRQPCDVHALIELAVGIVGSDAAAKQITIETEFGAERSGLHADPTRIQQVVWNLLRNAVKFAPPGGKVALGTTERTDEDGIAWFCLEVADNGVGIAAADLERIFNPFDQGTREGGHRFGGLGLGLSIARAVVEHHGGRITATSEGLGRGARFLVELPGARALTSGSTAPHGPALAAKRVAPLRLLLVEDHSNTLQALLGLLRREGHFVIGAGDIAGARAAAARERFDLVISDLGLPDGSGVELMRALRAEHGLRGIALSGYGMEEDVKRSLAAGFVTHLTKPVKISELRRELEASRSRPV